MNTMRQYLNFIKQRDLIAVESLPIRYMIAFGVGVAVGFKAIPANVVGFIYLAVIGIAFIKCLQNDIIGFFTWFPYAMYTEIFVRKKAMWLPYLTLQYFIIIVFAILFFLGKKKRLHFNGIFIFIAFVLLEVINNVYPNKIMISRTIITHSFAVLMPVLWASYHTLSSPQVLKLLTHLKIAGVYLTGIIVVAHITGGIDYGHQSSSDASNGLAPVQLSGYLGFISILFFFSVMNVEEAQQQYMNLILLAVVTTVMALTFSRGGIYFVGAAVGFYFIYNRSKMGNYFRFLILIPIAAIVYYSAVETTGGKILERYELEGSSGRDKLVKVAFEIFSQNLVLGVGTGNFNTEIVKQQLYFVESGAHNEFARVAAEHGIVGIFLFWGFFLFLFLDIIKRRQPQQQFSMYFLVLFCLIVVHNGLKISIQPILLMLAVGTTSVVYKPKRFPNARFRYTGPTPA